MDEKLSTAARDRGLVYNGRHLPYRAALITYAQQLRNNMTYEERKIYAILKSLRIKIRPQHPIDRYIVDFYLPDAMLVIEIDGEQHCTMEGKEYDSYRDTILEGYGLKVYRIKNDEIRSDIKSIEVKIKRIITQSITEKRLSEQVP